MSSFALSVTAATGRIRVSTETDLVRRAIAGNTHAFDELYRRHAPAAWRLGLAIAPDPAMATTAVAEGFVHALRVGRRQPVEAEPFRVDLIAGTYESALDLLRANTLPVGQSGALLVPPNTWRAASEGEEALR